MSMDVEARPILVSDVADTGDVESENRLSLLDIVAVLTRQRRFLWRFTLGCALLATIVSFLLPIRYAAKVVLLPPQQTSSVGSALLGQFGNPGSLSPLASLAGISMKNPADMYVSLLTSRTIEDALIERFGLMAEYRETRMSDVRNELEKRTTVALGSKDGLVRLSVEDRDPHRASDLANGYIEEFRKVFASLAVTEAARRRFFFEQQLETAKNGLSAAEEALKTTEQSTGVLQMDSQARSLIESASVLRGQVVAKQVQIQSMRSFAAEDNPSLIVAKEELAALQSQLDRLSGSKQDASSDINLSKGRMTGAGIEYFRRLRDLKYNETVFEFLTKELEIAKLDEAREGSIVQVVDGALPPDKPSSPHRLPIVVLSALIAFVLALAAFVIRQRWSGYSALPENRVRIAAIKNYWTSTPAS